MNSQNFISFDISKDSERFFNLLKELRPHLSFDGFQQIYKEAHANGYKMVGLEYGGELVALMGYRILCDFVHGRHLYIDDLVSSEVSRSKGYGAHFLKYAEELAKDHNCSNLRLCTGIENERGKLFYEKNSWNLRAIVFKKKL